jgi:hypothetical protein
MSILLLLLTYNGNTDVEGKGEGGTSRGEEAEGTGQGETGDVEETSARWFFLWTVSLSVCSSVGLFSPLSSQCVLVCVSVSACVKEREIDVRYDH